MISIVTSVHKRDISLWLESLSMQTNAHALEVVLVVYDDDIGEPSIVKQSDNGLMEIPVKVVNVERIAGAYPEAWLKNIGVRAAAGDVVCCTNIDILYTEDFFQEIERACTSGTLVQATRFDTPEGTTAEAINGTIRLSVPEGESLNVVVDPREGIATIPKASGDCQAMRKDDWVDMRGYNENMVGWGGLDTDLECRALLMGKSIHQLGFNCPLTNGVKVSHYHLWHEKNVDRSREEGVANGVVLNELLASGELQCNQTWGEYERADEVSALP